MDRQKQLEDAKAEVARLERLIVQEASNKPPEPLDAEEQERQIQVAYERKLKDPRYRM